MASDCPQCTIDTVLSSLTNTTTLDKFSTLAAAYCAWDGSDSAGCLGLCPNPDVAGIGVRFAFYAQAVMNAILIAISPSDAAAGAWGGTILTAALIVPAIIQKAQGGLTLHHAIIVLNLATLSTVSSLATAPMVPIWRGYEQENRTYQLEKMDKKEQTRGRIFLAMALIIQVILQWTWTIILFVNPEYSQDACSPSTILVWLGGAQQAGYIDEHLYWAWALWMLSYLFVSVGFSVVMVWSCPSSIHDNPQRRTPTNPRSFFRRWYEALPTILPGSEDYWSRWAIRITKWMGALIIMTYIIITETQIHDNNPRELPGEKNWWSFSQTAALLLALTPLWPLIMALLDQGEEANKRADSTYTRDTESLRYAPSARNLGITPGSDVPSHGDGEGSPFLPADLKSPRDATNSPEFMFSPEQRALGKGGMEEGYPFPPSWKSASDTALPRQRKTHQASSSTSDVYELEPLHKE